VDLGNYIMDKSVELREHFKEAKLKSIENVVLSKNSVVQEFLSKETSLLQKGKEVNLSEMNEVSSVPFIPNGTLVRFNVIPPRKRKAIIKDFYFLWIE